MARRRAEPKDDLVSDMMTLQAEGAPLGDGEISNNLQGLLIGGNLTTTDLIGNAIWLFLNHPGELAKLKADPSLINNAVEEVRWSKDHGACGVFKKGNQEADQWPADDYFYPVYEEALLGSFGEEVVPERTGKPGRPAGPHTEPPAGMCYGRVKKEKKKGRVVGVRTEVVFG